MPSPLKSPCRCEAADGVTVTTERTRLDLADTLIAVSAMNRLPGGVERDADWVQSNAAAVAGPPSPLKPKAPLPATVVITPVT